LTGPHGLENEKGNLVAEKEQRSKFITQLWPSDHSERIQALQEAAGSLPLYNRYLAGEFRQVWAELAALGDAVWSDPAAADALAVCFETMHRAKANVETLVDLLEAERYDFSPTVYSSYWRRSRENAAKINLSDEKMQSIVEDLQQPMRPLPKDLEPQREQLAAGRKEQLASARETARLIRDHRLGIVQPLMEPELVPRGWLRGITCSAGEMPLAIRAWHETIGGVNLAGSHPELAPHGVECDPLFVAPLKSVWDSCEAWQEDHAGDKDRPRFQMPISPSRGVKAGILVEGAPYVVTLPSAILDPVIENEPHGLSFVAYLRLAFEWGGFPGYADIRGKVPALIYRFKELLQPI
jgi:hypothetical protein